MQVQCKYIAIFALQCFHKRFMRCDVSRFQIPKIPPTTNKTIRFPNDVIEKVESAIVGKDCTFSAFVIEAVRTALRDLEDEKDRQM